MKNEYYLLNHKAIIGLVFLFFFFLLGIGVGLFVKTVGMTTVYLMPIMLLFGFTLMIEFLNFSKDSLTMKIANLFPIPQLIQMDESRAWGPLGIVGIVLIWITAAVLFTYICFVRTRKVCLFILINKVECMKNI